MVALLADDAIDELWTLFRKGTTRSRAWRAAQLAGLARMLDTHEAEFLAALEIDLGKCAFEAATLEIVVTRCEAKSMSSQLGTLMADERVATPTLMLPGTSYVRREPLGVCLVVAPFNYPLQLALAPVIGALGGGNCVVLKPSEKCPATASLLARFLPAYCKGIVVIEGGAAVAAELLQHRLSPNTSPNLSPNTSPSPTPTPSFSLTPSPTPNPNPRRRRWGLIFFTGSLRVGQMHIDIHVFLDILNIPGDDPAASPDYGKMVDAAAVTRARAMLAEDHGGEVVYGGHCDEKGRYVAPTIVLGPREDSRLLSEELFSPILPIIVVENAGEAIELAERRAAQYEPLAVYIFSEDSQLVAQALKRVPSGSALVNDVLLHFGNPNLPFGGVGPSGQGKYHGAASFRCFTHERAILERSTVRNYPQLLLLLLPLPPPSADLMKATSPDA
ncbi:Aldehyde/histidinol dehydrogenase [Pavlovales sp. CCMP2436]|nr:Aldehyde/histidinol dehydrogenase [Pavlovales sp. CCMP2436]